MHIKDTSLHTATAQQRRAPAMKIILSSHFSSISNVVLCKCDLFAFLKIDASVSSLKYSWLLHNGTGTGESAFYFPSAGRPNPALPGQMDTALLKAISGARVPLALSIHRRTRSRTQEHQNSWMGTEMAQYSHPPQPEVEGQQHMFKPSS